MNIENIEKRFCSYLEKFWRLSDVTPFLLAYIRLLILFENELGRANLNVVLERQKQLRGKDFNNYGFDEMIKLTRQDMERDIRSNAAATREEMLNRLLFCALLDTEENDFFYLTEPMFEFVQKMEVSPDQLKQILESEFVGFKA